MYNTDSFIILRVKTKIFSLIIISCEMNKDELTEVKAILTALFCIPISIFSERFSELYSYRDVPEVYLLMLGSRHATINISFSRLFVPVSGPWRALFCVSTIPDIKTSWYLNNKTEKVILRF